MAPDIEWDNAKNAALKGRYGFGFERILVALAEGALLDERSHPNEAKYRHQRQLVVEMEGYAWVVPFVSGNGRVFFKTMFPSRRATREYLGDRNE